MDFDKVKLLEDNIIVLPDADETTTKTGLIISTKESQQRWGTVMAVGPGQTLPDKTIQNSELQAGDRILFDKKTGTPTLIERQEYLIMYERQVILKLEA